MSEADAWATQALAAADELGFDRHYFAFNSLRTRALLALERHDLSSAAEQSEDILAMLDGGRPTFDYLAQVDRAHIWAAGGDLDEALASLPAARSSLRSERSILLTEANELEARIRLALGDSNGAMTIADRLPGDRQPVVAAMIHLKTDRPDLAEASLSALPRQPTTRRAAVELQLLQAEVALVQQSRQSPRLIREVLVVVDRHGFIQTVLDTVPHLIEHLVSGWEGYPRSDHLAALIAAAVEARQRGPIQNQPARLADPLTEAEMRVLRKLPQRLAYAEIAFDLHLSLNTVKTHLRHSYMKLGVTSRSAAVKRAAALGYL